MSPTKRDLINAVFEEGLTPASANFESFCEAWIKGHFSDTTEKNLAANFVKNAKVKWAKKAKYYKPRLLTDEYFDAPFVKGTAPPPPSKKGKDSKSFYRLQ